jgi:integrase
MTSKSGRLTALAIKAAELGKHFDGGGLFLHVQAGGRYWRMKYSYAGKEKLLAFGVYPAVGLSEARQCRDEARALLRRGLDPALAKRAHKLASTQSQKVLGNTFGLIAGEWLQMNAPRFAKTTLAKSRSILDNLVLPWIGSRTISEIEAPDVLGLLRRIEERGFNETAHRTKRLCGRVFRYAIATSRAKHDPTADLRGALAPVVSKARAAIINPSMVGELLRAIDGYSGSFVTCCALKLSALLFVRPGELRQAEWSEFDFESALWCIPADKMKMREEHVVPLSRQAIAILNQLKPLTGQGRYVFPGERNAGRPMSDNTVNAALRRMGFEKDVMTAHGFRAMASTRLNEMEYWSPDVIERQLAHGEKNRVRAAYNRAQYLDKRKHMMQAWADYLDELRMRGKVVSMLRRAM